MAGSPLITAVHQVLSNVQMPKQSGRNKHDRYDYSTRDDLFETIRREMIAAGLVWFPKAKITNFEEGPSTKSGIPQYRTQVEVTVAVHHVDGGTCVEFGWVGESVTNTDRGASMSATTAIRQAMINWLMLMGTDPEEATQQSQNDSVRQSSNSYGAPPVPADEGAADANQEAQARIHKFLRESGVESSDAWRFVRECIQHVDRKRGVDMPIEKYPVPQLDKWLSALQKSNADEVKKKVADAIDSL